MNQTADVVIVGAGVVGSSTALELTRAGLRVLVVDMAAGPGHGSTSASSAVVRFNYPTWDGMAAAWESKFRWEEWEAFLGHRDPDGLARFIKCGLVFLDVELMPRDSMARLFEKGGVPFEEWGADDLAARVPGIDVGRYFPPKPVGSEAFFDDAQERLGAIYTPDAGFVDDPQRAAANLAVAAMHGGATFLFKKKVQAVSQGAGTWIVHLNDGQRVEAPLVVNAAGPWSSRLNELAGVGEDFRVKVAPLRQEVHHVAAPPALREGFPILADADVGIYVRSDAGGNMLVGGTEPECDPLEWIDDPDAADPRPTAERFEAQVTRAARRLPDLSVPNRPRGIAGVYDAAHDWTPVYDRTAADGFFVAMGTSGNQFKNAPVIGSLMRALIVGVANGADHDHDPIRFVAPHTGHEVDLGSFSRRRQPNAASSGTVFG